MCRGPGKLASQDPTHGCRELLYNIIILLPPTIHTYLNCKFPSYNFLLTKTKIQKINIIVWSLYTNIDYLLLIVLVLYLSATQPLNLVSLKLVVQYGIVIFKFITKPIKLIMVQSGENVFSVSLIVCYYNNQKATDITFFLKN